MTRRAGRRARARGFTLLETIVTLVIVSMIVVVLMQALRHSLALRTRILHHEQAARMDALQEQWFRDTVHGALADLPDGLGAMQGGASGFELVSAAPLSGPGLAKIRWSLRGDASGAALVYDDAQWQGLEVLPGPLLDARFEYLGADGTWQGEWQQPPVSAPAAFDEMGAAPAAVEALPRMVRLSARTATGELSWLVSIPAHLQPPQLLRIEGSGFGL